VQDLLIFYDIRQKVVSCWRSFVAM